MPPDDPPDWQVCEWYWPWARIRQRIQSEKGVPTYFVVQLEYNHGDTSTWDGPSDWYAVARFDHEHGGTHDWRDEDPHLDLLRKGTKVDTVTDFYYIPIKKAPAFAVDYLRRNHHVLLSAYERDCGIENGFRSRYRR